MSDVDLVVVGAGATGLGAARAARRSGRRVALVEAGRPGGDCTHYGCVPSKALLEAARRVHAARSGLPYGFTADVRVDFPAVMERVRRVVAEVEQDESPELLAREGIELLTGWGSFTGPRELDVDGRRVTSERFVVATGTTAVVPPVEGLRDVPYLDNRSVFDLRELPPHLVVLGGGATGVELAQAFRRLGSAVTLVEAGPSLLPGEEPAACAGVERVLVREGMTVRTGAVVERVSAGPVLHLADGTTVAGSHLLLAVGRTPSTTGLGLENAGVALAENGLIVTDRHLRASGTVWAAGDCTTELRFTHVGDEQGRLAAGNAFRPPRLSSAFSDRVVPRVVFTDPEVARVGLTEAEAVARYGDRVRVSTVDDTASDRGRTSGQTDGFVTLIGIRSRLTGPLTMRLVGMTVVGPMAGEQIAQGALAMQTRMLVARLASTVVAYPTWNVSVRLAAARFFGAYGGQPARPGRAG